MTNKSDFPIESMTKSRMLAQFIDDTARLTEPGRIVWCDGSEAEKERLEKQAVEAGVLIPLNQQKRPGCYLHRSNPNDVARTEQLTFICTPTEGGGRADQQLDGARRGLREAARILTARCAGRTMYVVPYVMGPVGSPFAKVGVELTDSVYVALNMRIMTRMGKAALDDAGRLRRFQPRPALHAGSESRAPLHLPLPAGQHHLVGRQRLRRQRAAQQEVLRAAHRQLRWAAARAGSPSTC